jgi:hypothetical protein
LLRDDSARRRRANRFGWNDLNAHVELLDHPADDLELLAVLLAEHRDSRAARN